MDDSELEAQRLHDQRQRRLQIDSLKGQLASANQIIKQQNDERIKIVAEGQRNDEKLSGQLAALRRQLEHDRTLVAEGVTALKKAIHGRQWLTEGRGSYSFDDDHWHDEFAAAISEIEAAYAPLGTLGSNWANCSKDPAEIAKARLDLEGQLAEAQAKLAPSPCGVEGHLKVHWEWPMCWHWDSKYKTPEEALADGGHAEQKPQALVSAHANFCTLCAREQAVVLAEHKNHVQFAKDIYSILVDPCADGVTKEAEMFETLKLAATEQRQWIHDAKEREQAACAAVLMAAASVKVGTYDLDSVEKGTEVSIPGPWRRAILALIPTASGLLEQRERMATKTLDALGNLVMKMTAIQNDERYKSVWMISAIHGMPYDGPTWEHELEEARVAIAAARGKVQP